MIPLFKDDIEWNRLEEILEGWIGTPYRHCASKKTGSDCGGWIPKVFHEFGIVRHILKDEYYARRWYMTDRDGIIHRKLLLYKDCLLPGFLLCEESPEGDWFRGDIMIFQLPRAKHPNHLAIYLGAKRPNDPFVIHCLQSVGMRKAAIRSSWQRFLVGIFRIYRSD